jgi:integrase
MFTTSNGTHIRPDNLHKHFVVACKKAGIDSHDDGRHWSIYGLRYTAASQLLKDRVPMQIVCRTLGHSSITVTLDVYAHLAGQDSELAAESMGKR